MSPARLAELFVRPASVADLTPDEALSAMVELLTLQALLASHVRVVPAAATPEATPPDDSWITADEAARVAGVTRRVIYGWSRRRDWGRFTARPTRKVLRIKQRAFLGWLESTGRDMGRA